MPYRKEKNRLSNTIASLFGEETHPSFTALQGDIQTWRDPYDVGYSPTYARKVHFTPGVTILVGCNGCGKTTLLKNIKSVCQNQNVACLHFDNLKEGGTHSIGEAMFYRQMDIVASLWTASEGEQISYNIGLYARDIGEAIRTEFANAPEIWILLDASDSGLSIDNILELKHLFDLVLSDTEGTDVYIIAAANEYELANGMRCLDVMTGKEITFQDYEDYKNFIIKSRDRKDHRIQKALEKRREQSAKNHE